MNNFFLLMDFKISPPHTDLLEKVKRKIDYKIKPLGALGQLEKVALQIALIQQTTSPTLSNPHIIVFAADHGIAQEGVSAYPSEVTAQMVNNFLTGGAAINVFCRQHNIALRIVDAGVKTQFEPHDLLENAKIALGTESFLHQLAMSLEQAEQALEKGAALVKSIAAQGCNVIGFGEMGIGNTSSAAVLMHVLTDIALEKCVGRGTGLTDQQLSTKIKVLTEAVGYHKLENLSALKALATFGGFEIAQMAGAMLQAASEKMVIMIDGFIASAAFLVAYHYNKDIREYAIFSHLSAEQGHQLLLHYFKAEPLLQLGLRLGEGTACALAWPIVVSAVNFFNEMASFEQANVSQKIT